MPLPTLRNTLTVGDVAPDFQTTDQDGTTRTLQDYQDSWLLLYFYPHDNTPGCTKHACELRDHYDSLKHLVQVVGVSDGKAASHADFIARNRLPFSLLSDPGHRITKAYRANRLVPKRVSYLIDPQGIIRGIFTKQRATQHVAEARQEAEQLVGTIFNAA